MVGFEGSNDDRLERSRRVIELYNKGVKQHQIARRMGMHATTVSNIIVRAKKEGVIGEGK